MNNVSEKSSKKKTYDHYNKMQKRAYGSVPPKKARIRTGGWMGSESAVVGTCQKLEKQYLRLTSAPDPSVVRPEYILKKAFAMLERKWKIDRNYKYTCEQFKSIRQDLTVQHIKNLFTVKVYETNARKSLSVGDLSEFNQCQTQLLELYDQKQSFRKNFFEFTLYRLLYYLVTDNSSSLHSMLKDLHPDTRQQNAVRYGLKIRECVVENNYVRFYKIYKDAPYEGTLLTTKLLPLVRYRALERITRAYRPHKLPLLEIRPMLHIEHLKELREFLLDRGGILDPTKKFFLTKGSIFTSQFPKKKQKRIKKKMTNLELRMVRLFIPEVKQFFNLFPY